jgi:hypothetical protein
MTLAIRVNCEATRRPVDTEPGPWLAGLSLQFDDEEPFPSADWIDFPVVVLSWWLESYLRMADSGHPQACSFMNGPFEFLTVPVGERLLIRYRRRTANGDVETRPTTSVAVAEYAGALRVAVETILTALPADDTGDSDLLRLRALLGQMPAASAE